MEPVSQSVGLYAFKHTVQTLTIRAVITRQVAGSPTNNSGNRRHGVNVNNSCESSPSITANHDHLMQTTAIGCACEPWCSICHPTKELTPEGTKCGSHACAPITEDCANNRWL